MTDKPENTSTVGSTDRKKLDEAIKKADEVRARIRQREMGFEQTITVGGAKRMGKPLKVLQGFLAFLCIFVVAAIIVRNGYQGSLLPNHDPHERSLDAGEPRKDMK